MLRLSRRILALAVIVILVTAFGVTVAEAPLDISGTYKAQGINPNGTKYKGTVTFKKNDIGSYDVIWSVGIRFQGTAMLDGDTVNADWGDSTPKVYTVKQGGKVLEGLWDHGNGIEILTR
ncbi:fibronectin-binding protein [Leptospira fletcheri]|uniref:Fibronectin-binding protein n=1 Tax=Leptospira fletcheri TaxID=2484981 RepID=A0A4R9GCL4_9LEPT|nr:fibronectin-binding protein [Leptospira fletcheri]TGK08757.1 fibronectin-binding protein [Leptospira fletcheri]